MILVLPQDAFPTINTLSKCRPCNEGAGRESTVCERGLVNLSAASFVLFIDRATRGGREGDFDDREEVFSLSDAGCCAIGNTEELSLEGIQEAEGAK